jgi:hypothetical protein
MNSAQTHPPADDGTDVELSEQDLRAVAEFAAECAMDALAIFDKYEPEDGRPRSAIEAAQAFANGANRTKLQRTSSLAAHAAARATPHQAAQEAARAAGHAAAAAYLHPIARRTQVKHILGAAAHAARATELDANGDQLAGTLSIERAQKRASADVVAVLRRYPAAPSNGNRVTKLMRLLDTSLRDP